MKQKTLFYCTECGNETAKWAGKCPACGAWNTIVEQVEKQLNKLIPISKVKTLENGTHIPRMLSLIKVAVTTGQRADIMRISELMGARIVDATRSSLTIEFSDTAERTDTLEMLLRPYGIREIVRTGVIAIEKGADPTRKKAN